MHKLLARGSQTSVRFTLVYQIRWRPGFTYRRRLRMITLDRHASGRHFLQIPGPTNVPDRV
ncbi:MAG: hypothetical protein E6H71_14285, partial [Betaproteobacteria bacterium]